MNSTPHPTATASTDSATGPTQNGNAPDRKKLAVAMVEILKNPDAPEALKDGIYQFLVESSSGPVEQYYTQPAIVEHILEFHAAQSKDEAATGTDYWATSQEVEGLAELAVTGHTAYDRERALVTLLDRIGHAEVKDTEDLVIAARDSAIKHSANLTENYAAAVAGREIEDRPIVSDRPHDDTHEPAAPVVNEASATAPDAAPAIEAPPDTATLKGMSTYEVEQIAERYGVDTSKRWSKGELIRHIEHAYEWLRKPDTDGIRGRALALLNPNREEKLNGKQRWQLEFYCLMDRFDVVAQLVERIEQNEDFDDILIAADERNLPDETVEALCKEVADHLEGENLIGYLFLLFDHVLAHARTAMDTEGAVYEIRRMLLNENGHGRDEAVDHLRQSALLELRKKYEIGGDESEGETE